MTGFQAKSPSLSGDNSTKLSRKMHYVTVDISVFHTTVKGLNITEAQLATELGYSDSGWRSWQSTGKMPKVAALACEALRRRQAPNGNKNTLMLARVTSQDTLLAVKALLKALSVEFTELVQ